MFNSNEHWETTLSSSSVTIQLQDGGGVQSLAWHIFDGTDPRLWEPTIKFKYSKDLKGLIVQLQEYVQFKVNWLKQGQDD